jgi:hypothetical protein
MISEISLKFASLTRCAIGTTKKSLLKLSIEHPPKKTIKSYVWILVVAILPFLKKSESAVLGG